MRIHSKWNVLQKFGFVVLFSYLILYINSTQFVLSGVLEKLWQKVIPFFANAIGFERSITVFTNGSGDTTYNYFQILFFAILSVVIALIVLIVDRKRNNYRTLLSWLTVLVRYYLAFQMINYGFQKLFYLQFVFPSELKLDQKLGDFSPMGLLWNFMGYSKAYTVFTGALEFIGGMLLLSRRTSTLGALTTFGVMLNVMMMNICYDVPVKQLSTHLVLMSIFLISLDVKRLWSFFIKNDSAAPRRFQEIIPAKYIKYKNIIKWILITGCLCFSISKMLAYKKIRSQATDSIFHGKHTVEKFERMRTVENNSEPTTFEDWKLFYQSWEGHAQVKTINDRQVNIRFEPDTVTNLVQVKINNFSDYKEWTYMVLESGKIQLNGIYDSDTLEIILKKENINDNLLVSRGFRWINEYPFNR